LIECNNAFLHVIPPFRPIELLPVNTPSRSSFRWSMHLYVVIIVILLAINPARIPSLPSASSSSPTPYLFLIKSIPILLYYNTVWLTPTHSDM